MRDATTIHHNVVKLHQHVTEMEYRAALLKQGRACRPHLLRMVADAQQALALLDELLRADDNTYKGGTDNAHETTGSNT